MVSEFWMPWSDVEGWAFQWQSSTEFSAKVLAEYANNTHLYGVTDWRPVRIPTPSKADGEGE